MATRTDEVIEPKKGPGEFAFTLHDDPDARADTSVDEFYEKSLEGG